MPNRRSVRNAAVGLATTVPAAAGASRAVVPAALQGSDRLPHGGRDGLP